MIKKKVVIFSIEYVLSISGLGLIFQSPAKVISSGEVLKRSIVRSVINEVSAEISNTFCEFVTKVEGTRTRAIPGNAVSMKVTVSLVSEMVNKYSGTLTRYRHVCRGGFSNPQSQQASGRRRTP